MKQKTVYLVRNTDSEDESEHYWEQYESLTDAVTEHHGQEVFTARPRLLGRFKVKTAPIRIKKRKAKK